MRREMKLVLFVMVWAMLAGALSGAGAYSFGDVLVSGSYGSGTNTALMIVDFGTKSFAFEYRFDGVKSGADMVMETDDAGSALQIDYTDWGEGNGIFVDEIRYNSQPRRDTVGVYPGWAYYTSTDGANWTQCSTGSSFRTLIDGSWDAWNYTGYDPDTWLPTAPPPVTPVPEPSSMLALCSLIGLVASPKLLRARAAQR